VRGDCGAAASVLPLAVDARRESRQRTERPRGARGRASLGRAPTGLCGPLPVAPGALPRIEGRRTQNII